MNVFKVYCVGNQFVEEDSFAKRVAQGLKLKGVEFVNCHSPLEILLKPKEDIVVFLDVVKNINQTILIEESEQIKSRKTVSPHDLDLGFFLKLLSEVQKRKGVRAFIIGIPQKGNIERVKEEVIEKVMELRKRFTLLRKFPKFPE